MTNIYDSIGDDYREGWKAAKADSQIEIDALKKENIKLANMNRKLCLYAQGEKESKADMIETFGFDPTEGNGW